MSDKAETAAIRLWRDRVQVREQERNEAQARARIAEEKVAALTAEDDRLAREKTHLRDHNNRLAVQIARLSARNERLAADIAWLRAQPAPEAAQVRTEPKKDLKAVNDE